MIGIVAHFVSKSDEAKDCLLGLRRVIGSHSGENMAETIIHVIELYELQDRLGYFVLDNITSNDTCVREILEYLQPRLDPKKRRLRCFGHILNLAVKAFLSGKDPETSGQRIELEFEEEIGGRKKPEALGKLRDAVTYIRRTPQRREAFMKLVNTSSEMGRDGYRYNSMFSA